MLLSWYRQHYTEQKTSDIFHSCVVKLFN